jgi:hypothetical protein
MQCGAQGNEGGGERKLFVAFQFKEPAIMNHHCHWPGCETEVPPAMWGCRRHWYQLPKRLRDRIWETYMPGQEITKTPSAEYVEVAKEVQEWICGSPVERSRIRYEPL